MKKIKKGFTLVELIVVITILAILGTIGFISLQGYSSDARNSKRITDLNNIASSIAAKATAGVAMIAFVSGDPNARVSSVSIAGTGVTVGNDYDAGKINYVTLGLKPEDFQDSVFSTAYAVGTTTRDLGKYQLAAKMEKGGGNYVAKVTGDFSPRISGASVTPTGTGTKLFTIASTDIGKLYVGDTLTGTNLVAGTKIIKVSADGTTISLNGTITTLATVSLAAPESAGLIDAGGTNAGIVITDGTTYFPY